MKQGQILHLMFVAQRTESVIEMNQKDKNICVLLLSLQLQLALDLESPS
jgi:hypothetical protein